MELSWLQDFLALAETGNFSRTAERRTVTQPGLSRRIRALEDWVGAALFERGSQPVALTEAGRQFLPSALEISRRLLAARGAARAAAGGGLQLAATHALSFSFLPAWLRRLRAQELQVGMTLMSDHLQACEQAMLDRQVQFLLCHRSADAQGRLDRAGYTALRVGVDRLLPVASPRAGDGQLPTARPRAWDGSLPATQDAPLPVRLRRPLPRSPSLPRRRSSPRILRRRCARWSRTATAWPGCRRA